MSEAQFRVSRAALSRDIKELLYESWSYRALKVPSLGSDEVTVGSVYTFTGNNAKSEDVAVESAVKTDIRWFISYKNVTIIIKYLAV